MGRDRQVLGAGEGESADTAPSLRLVRTAAGVLVAIGVVVLAARLVLFPLDGFQYAAGLAGTPGRFTAARCHSVPAGYGSRRICTGTFVPAKGRPVDGAARIKDSRVGVGGSMTLRRRPDGRYVQPGPANAALDLAGVFGIVSLAALALVVLSIMARRVRFEVGVPLRANPRPWGTLLPLLIGLCAGFAVAAVLSLLAAILLSLGQAIFS
ncbi:hypothetical protein NE236_21145 [Actinoallomurus purpureus]|uniref:hypothetical protein n=1 Tax=Actinoallomurus purpureus TaxID=478114 RepID=UPI002091F8D2|nr:hypothetical protein [Actinoallomurus purpureus]MCO6007488.1 hypothetical protein [Actinoallomurus purpureus]